jgi:ArsR family transcriptional regulator, arsenate/arsenite/antimonite-responsive transcriptional repressor
LKDTARFFKVLADEARLKMLWLLFNRRELCVCDIMATLEITQSKASRHLAALRNAGLVNDRKEGLWSYYSLRPIEDPDVAAQLKLLRTNLSKQAGAKQLVKKLNTWLKEKERGTICLNGCGLIRAIKNASRPSPNKQPNRGKR